MLMALVPVLLVVSLVVTLKFLLWRRITDNILALVLGVVVFPLILGASVFVGLYMAHISNIKLLVIAPFSGVVSGMLGGWIWASVGYLANRKKVCGSESKTL